MQDIKNIVFDLGGVLVDLDIERCREAFRSLGMDAIAQIINPYHPAEMIAQLEHGQITFHQACEQMRRLAARPEITDKQIAWAYGEFLLGVPLSKMRQIDQLRARGLRTYVLSNNNPSSMHFIRQMFSADGKTMNDYFDHIYLSWQMGELKPAPSIFRQMVDHSGMCPAQTLFIDDGPKNIATARELGFAVHLALPDEDFEPLFAVI